VLLLVPLTQILIERFGWRGAYHILGGAMLVLAVPILLLPWRRFASGTRHIERLARADAAAAELWTLRGAMRHHAFWALFSIFFFTAIGMMSIAVQVVTYLIEVGFAPLQAATAWGLSGVLLLFGMTTVSWLDSIMGRRRAILFSYTLTVLGILMLWSLSRLPSLWLLGGFLFCFGSTMGSRGPLVTAAAMTIFRGKRVGTIVGTISIGAGLGSGIGAWAGGFIHDLAQSYDYVFAFAIGSVLIGMTPFLVAPALRES
jgi:MFS family permease